MKKPKRASTQPAFLSALIRTAYLPDEIPPAVTTKHFAAFCEAEYTSLKASQSLLIRRTTKYDTFTAPRPASGRRNLALVHPLSQLAISLLITEHRAKIKKLVSGGGRSLYETDEDPTKFKAFRGLDFRKWEVLAERIHSQCPFILKADISRFFYTAYTHSIPWAVIGKEKVKDWLAHDRKKLDSHWSNHFDSALQSCQSRETFGIPVGPDTSRLIAEILLAGVESDRNLAALIRDRPACRLVDDFIIGFDDEGAARKALAALRSALWKYNLQLNDQKTSVSHAHTPIREKWKLEFDAIFVSNRDSAKQERDIYRLVDLTLHFCSEAQTGQPATWACRRLSALTKIRRNFGVILDALFRLARDFPSCISHVAEFLINNQQRCRNPKMLARIAKWAKATIRANLHHEHDFEVAWCLLVTGVLGIAIEEEDVAPFDKTPNSLLFAILGILQERGLLSFPLSRWPWRAHLKKGGIYGENWLPYYEAVRRNWTADKKMVAVVRADSVLSTMLAAKVTFLEDAIFDAARINISRRVFRRAKAGAAPSQPWLSAQVASTEYE